MKQVQRYFRRKGLQVRFQMSPLSPKKRLLWWGVVCWRHLRPDFAVWR